MIKRNKKVLLACAALTLAGLLGACSSSSGTASENSSVKESRADSISEETVQGKPEMTETTAAEGMRTVETDKGPVEIPVNPQVIVSDYYLGEFLAVDVKPVIASPYSLSNPFLEGKTDGIEELNTVSAETSLEMIVAQEPDLIVTITEADYEKYAEIAPTVYIQDGKRSDEDLFRYIADLVGKGDEAEVYITDFNKRVMDVKKEIQGIVG
ncbi:ABC transporter substrate-binding protein, partial [Eisenbergiella tayi]